MKKPSRKFNFLFLPDFVFREIFREGKTVFHSFIPDVTRHSEFSAGFCEGKTNRNPAIRFTYFGSNFPEKLKYQKLPSFVWLTEVSDQHRAHI